MRIPKSIATIIRESSLEFTVFGIKAKGLLSIILVLIFLAILV